MSDYKKEFNKESEKKPFKKNFDKSSKNKPLTDSGHHRLQKIISHAGITSRRKAEDLIKAGKVTVNGKVAQIGDKGGPDDTIIVDGKKVEKYVTRHYYMLNKPKGYVCSLKPEAHLRSIFRLIPCKDRIYHVGRLDTNSRGLILLTNDGDFANHLMHPSFEISKTYHVTCDAVVPSSAIREMENGVGLEDGKTSPAVIKTLSFDPPVLEIIIHEGKKHIIRRMISHFGIRVIDLQRVRIGRLVLGTLREGKYRKLTQKERDDFLSVKAKPRKLVEPEVDYDSLRMDT